MSTELPNPRRDLMNEIKAQVELGNCSTCPRIGELASSLQTRVDHNTIVMEGIVGEGQSPTSPTGVHAQNLLDIIFPDLNKRPREIRVVERQIIAERLDTEINLTITEVAAMVAQCPGANDSVCGLNQTDTTNPIQ